jgi:hypothetical protein
MMLPSEYLLFLQKRFRGLSSTVASNRIRNEFSPKRPKVPFKHCNNWNVIDHWPYSLILGWHGTTESTDHLFIIVALSFKFGNLLKIDLGFKKSIQKIV